MATTYREFFKDLTEAELDQPMLFYAPEEGVRELQLFRTLVKTSISDPLDEDEECEEETETHFPAGTLFLTPEGFKL